jgi:DNA-binding response OmpR family regulator
MGEHTEPQGGVASVLIVAADPTIESLMGELVALAGHRPVFDTTRGAAGEALRWTRPDVALVDTALPAPVVNACREAAEEIGCRPVLTSSTASAQELASEASARDYPYFALPGGPRPLARIIERALSERRSDAKVTLALRGSHGMGSVHPALRAALASVARTRAHTIRAEALQRDNVQFRDNQEQRAAESERSRNALRAAVRDYTRQLKSSSLPEREVLAVVNDAVRDCAAAMGADAELDSLLLDSERWAREAFESRADL